ncbi:hypothetical protein AAF712_013113 [Marasmius tenuissimus]|uniref:Uncharacterized protein n=1 Tax=Marasmius tenuissimus TaxID=585030 RepID=A0ABR2ZEM3_9AGAR
MDLAFSSNLPSEQISTVAFYLPDIVNNGLEMLDVFLGVSLDGNCWDAGQIDKVGNEGIVFTKYARGSDAQKPDLALARRITSLAPAAKKTRWEERLVTQTYGEEQPTRVHWSPCSSRLEYPQPWQLENSNNLNSRWKTRIQTRLEIRRLWS